MLPFDINAPKATRQSVDREIKPLTGIGPAFKADPIGFLKRFSDAYGPIAESTLLGRRVILTTDPAIIQGVLRTQAKHFTKGREYDALRFVLGDGLLTSEGSFHRHQRKLSQGAFHHRKITDLVPVMQQTTVEWINRLPAISGPFDIRSHMSDLALSILNSTLLKSNQTELQQTIGDPLEYLLEDANDRIGNLVNLPRWVPTPHHLRLAEHRRTLNGVVDRIIAERKQSDTKQDDVLQALVDSQDEDSGERMSSEQLRFEVMTLFLAGHETTANALSWTLWLLTLNREVLGQLQDEIDSTIGQAPITADDLTRMPYLQAVFKEGLRMYPPAWAISRRAKQAVELPGLSLDKGDSLLISPLISHYREDLWDSPYQFEPRRFMDKERSYDRGTYFPFGDGPRVCIGSHFATLEGSVALATILQQFDISSEVAHIPPLPLITMRPGAEVLIKFTQRHDRKL